MSKYYNADEVESLLGCGCAYAIRDLPTIDIVRCKNCKHWDDDTSKCTKWTTDTYEQAQTNADAFCSYGERIDDE